MQLNDGIVTDKRNQELKKKKKTKTKNNVSFNFQ